MSIVASQITPGMTLNLDNKIYRVESNIKVTVTKSAPFIKTKLRDLINDEIIEKNFKLDQIVHEVSLTEKNLEFLYPEGAEYLFLDIGTLEQVLVSSQVLGNRIHFLKEGVQVKAMFYGAIIFALELPQFLELMVVKTETTGVQKFAILDTGARLAVPAFIEVGDVIKVEPLTSEYIQRV